MTWVVLVALVIQTFGPQIAEWLQKLLMERAATMGDVPDTADPAEVKAQLDTLFDVKGLAPFKRVAVRLVRHRLERMMADD